MSTVFLSLIESHRIFRKIAGPLFSTDSMPMGPKFPNCRAHGTPIDFSRIAARFPNSRQSSGERKHIVCCKCHTFGLCAHDELS